MGYILIFCSNQYEITIRLAVVFDLLIEYQLRFYAASGEDNTTSNKTTARDSITKCFVSFSASVAEFYLLFGWVYLDYTIIKL